MTHFLLRKVDCLPTHFVGVRIVSMVLTVVYQELPCHKTHLYSQLFQGFCSMTVVAFSIRKYFASASSVFDC